MNIINTIEELISKGRKKYQKTYVFPYTEEDDISIQPLNIKSLDEIVSINVSPEGYAKVFISSKNIHVKHIFPKTVIVTIQYYKKPRLLK